MTSECKCAPVWTSRRPPPRAPLAVNIEFNVAARLAYFRCISASIVSFSSGMAPGMAVEIARRGLGEELRPNADELEAMLRVLNVNVAQAK